MSNRKNNKGKKKGKKGGGNAQDGSIKSLAKYNDNKVIFFKDIVPPRILTRLKFVCNRKLNNAGFGTASIQFNANGIYDFDPAVASNQVSGFDELGTIWGRYRVFAVKAKCTFANMDVVTPSIINLGFDSEPYAANAKLLSNYDGPNQMCQLTTTSGQTTARLAMRRRAIDVTGDAQVNVSNNWSGTTTSNPVALWYVSIAADCTPTGQTYTLGVAIRFEAEIEVEWYERYDVDSSLHMEMRQKHLDNVRLRMLMRNKI